MSVAPLVLVNAVGLTTRLLAHAPRLGALAAAGRVSTPVEDLPAVTCTAQASMLTGVSPQEHGIVANGWLYRDTTEVRFWQQSNRLLQAEPLYATARRRAAERGRPFKSAKLFWWFNQGAAVDVSVTPKPHYGIDGNKVFGITGTPAGLTDRIEAELGPFPFHTFWGPLAGLPCTRWIARCAAWTLSNERPDLTLVYLPHLDYDPQRFGPSGTDMPARVRELDDACEPLLDAAKAIGARVWLVSEYGHCDVSRAVTPNVALRQAGLLTVRDGPFGETPDLFQTPAFAVCDHQLAHVYVNDPAQVSRVRALMGELPGVARVYAVDERAEIGLDHPRAGELVALAEPDAWFAYPFWLDARRAPDYARAVAIHAKPGYDPCELFFDPRLRLPALHAARRVVQKKLGFRMTMDVVPLEPGIVRGGHGLRAADPNDRPVLVTDAAAPPVPAGTPMSAVRNLCLEGLDLG